MNIKSLISILFVVLLSGCAVATVGTVYYLKSSSHEVATVNIHAKPENVYRTIIATAENNKKIKITSRDDELMQLELIKNNSPISVKVIAVNSTHAQLIISSSVSLETEGDNVLDNVLAICEKLNVTCSASDL